MAQTRPTIDGLTITFLGRPKAQPRGRTPHGRRRPVSLTGKARAYAQGLQRAARDAVMNLGGEGLIAAAWGGLALQVDILCVFDTRQRDRWGTLHTPKPDKDNLTKMVLDCLMRAGALGGDDSRAATGMFTKVWGERGFMAVTVKLATETQTRPTNVEQLAAAPSWLLR